MKRTISGEIKSIGEGDRKRQRDWERKKEG